MQGFGAKVIAYDLYENEELKKQGVTYVSKEELLQRADVVSLHCPLLPSTYHMIDKDRWALSYCALGMADRTLQYLVHRSYVQGVCCALLQVHWMTCSMLSLCLIANL